MKENLSNRNLLVTIQNLYRQKRPIIQLNKIKTKTINHYYDFTLNCSDLFILI